MKQDPTMIILEKWKSNRFTSYVRRCRKCENLFRSKSRHAKICFDCNTNKYKAIVYVPYKKVIPVLKNPSK